MIGKYRTETSHEGILMYVLTFSDTSSFLLQEQNWRFRRRIHVSTVSQQTPYFRNCDVNKQTWKKVSTRNSGTRIELTPLERSWSNLQWVCIKLRCDTRFQRAFTACSCIFKVITLVWANQHNLFENAC